jgi:hypothetical protein
VIANNETLNNSTIDVLNNYMNNFCVKQDLLIPNAVKPSACFYSGFFFVSYLWQRKDNFTALNLLTGDYC